MEKLIVSISGLEIRESSIYLRVTTLDSELLIRLINAFLMVDEYVFRKQIFSGVNWAPL